MSYSIGRRAEYLIPRRFTNIEESDGRLLVVEGFEGGKKNAGLLGDPCQKTPWTLAAVISPTHSLEEHGPMPQV